MIERGERKRTADDVSTTLSFYATKDGKISVSYQGWDQSKTVPDGQQFVIYGGQGGRGARCRAQAATVLALEAARSLGGGHSAIAAVSVTKTLLWAPDTALEAMEADLF
jgi:hypothetical protein